MADENLILSLTLKGDEGLKVGVTSDKQMLASGLYSFFTMCSNGELGEFSEDVVKSCLLGIGEWIGNLPPDEMAFIMAFLNQCAVEANERNMKIKKCDC